MILTSVGHHESQMSVLEIAEAHQDVYFLCCPLPQNTGSLYFSTVKYSHVIDQVQDTEKW